MLEQVNSFFIDISQNCFFTNSNYNSNASPNFSYPLIELDKSVSPALILGTPTDT